MHTKLSKFLFIFLFSLFSLPAYAGFIAGIQVGETDTKYSASNAGLNQANAHNLGVGGRIYAGYLFNPILGLEAGYLRFHNTRMLNMNNTGQNGVINENSYDLLLRASFPIRCGISILGRFGAAYLQANPSQSLQALSTNDFHNGKVGHWRPAFGLALAYEIAHNWNIDASWLHILKHRSLPDGTLIAAGVSYSFC